MDLCFVSSLVVFFVMYRCKGRFECQYRIILSMFVYVIEYTTFFFFINLYY